MSALIAAAKAIHDELGARCSHDPLGDDCWYLARAALAAAAAATPCAECGQPINGQPSLNEHPDIDPRIWCGPDCRDNAGESREQQLHG